MKVDIIIIGAGAAGLMAAASIIEHTQKSSFHIHIFEKNLRPGKKVLLSGGGRCNVTTSIEEKKVLESKYVRGWNFIKKSIGKFSPRKCREWFEYHGVPLKIQEEQRVFPVSDSGADIVGVFENIFANNRDKVSLHYSEGVTGVKWDYDKIKEDKGDIQGEVEFPINNTPKKYCITTQKGEYRADMLIITTGGNAYSHTGSTGDGYAFARALGHSVTPLGPSLSSFLTGEDWIHALSGLAFEHARITYKDDSGSIKKLDGPILLTHFGISGPLTFMLSSHLAFAEIGKSKTVEVLLSPNATMSQKDWDEFLKKEFHEHPKKFLLSILTEKLSRRFAEGFILEYFPNLISIFTGSISKNDRESIAKLLGSGVTITLLERRPGDEFVTAGGVSTDELDPETMESKKQKHLYFAGEVLDVDGYTGGFSLQICWSSGYVIGKNIGEYLSK